jgi:hypothetical protein
MAGDLYLRAKDVPSVLDDGAIGVDPISISVDTLNLTHVQQMAADISNSLNVLQQALAENKVIKINP